MKLHRFISLVALCDRFFLLTGQELRRSTGFLWETTNHVEFLVLNSKLGGPSVAGGFTTQKIAPIHGHQGATWDEKWYVALAQRPQWSHSPCLPEMMNVASSWKWRVLVAPWKKLFLEFDLDVICESTKPKGTSSSQLLGMFSQDRISCIWASSKKGKGQFNLVWWVTFAQFVHKKIRWHSLCHTGGEAVKRPLLDGSHSETNQPRWRLILRYMGFVALVVPTCPCFTDFWGRLVSRLSKCRFQGNGEMSPWFRVLFWQVLEKNARAPRIRES